MNDTLKFFDQKQLILLSLLFVCCNKCSLLIGKISLVNGSLSWLLFQVRINASKARVLPVH